MRGILLAMLVAAGIGLVGSTGSVSAAPINGFAIGQAADATSPVETVQHWRWGSRRGGHWRWGSRGGHWRYGSRGPSRRLCHRPYSSRWRPCW